MPTCTLHTENTNIVCKTIRDIKSGEELCYYHTPTMLLFDQKTRQSEMLAYRWIKCECERCMDVDNTVDKDIVKHTDRDTVNDSQTQQKNTLSFLYEWWDSLNCLDINATGNATIQAYRTIGNVVSAHNPIRLKLYQTYFHQMWRLNNMKEAATVLCKIEELVTYFKETGIYPFCTVTLEWVSVMQYIVSMVLLWEASARGETATANGKRRVSKPNRDRVNIKNRLQELHTEKEQNDKVQKLRSIVHGTVPIKNIISNNCGQNIDIVSMLLTDAILYPKVAQTLKALSNWPHIFSNE